MPPEYAGGTAREEGTMNSYSMYDESLWDDVEAIESARLDADLEQAEMDAVGDAITRARKAGRCTHGSVQGYSGGPRSTAQEGLKPGQSRCTDGCGRVFADDDDLWQAIDEAVHGS